MKNITELKILDLVYGAAISGGVYVDLWQYGFPSYTGFAGTVYGVLGIVFGISVGLYKNQLSSKTEWVLFAVFTATAFPLLHITSSAEFGLTLVTATWTAIAVERLYKSDSTDR